MHYYYNDQWQLLTETIEVDDVETVYAIYHWHPFYIDALATRMRASSTHFFLHDANFNVTAAVDDSTDAVVERYNYTPYGTPTVLDANFAADSDNISDIANTHLYTGRERDPETGLQLNRHRYYASHLGRWLTQDPIGYDGGSNNLYEYVNGRPIRGRDSLGLMSCPELCRGSTDWFSCMEKCDEQGTNYPIVGGPNIVTIMGSASSDPSGGKFQELPPGISGTVYPDVGSIDEMIDTLDGHKKNCNDDCIDTLIVCAHGCGTGICNIDPGTVPGDDGKPRPVGFPSDAKDDQIAAIQSHLCPDAVVILATCAASANPNTFPDELQDRANTIGRPVCQCPPGSNHSRPGLTCTHVTTGEQMEMMCAFPE